MSKLIEIDLKADDRGKLAILESELPFDVKRVFYIFDVPKAERRGGHRHKKTRQLLVCLNGSCSVEINDGSKRSNVELDAPNKCLLLEPEDFHWMKNFSEASTLLVLASTQYDADDYIFEDYSN